MTKTSDKGTHRSDSKVGMRGRIITQSDQFLLYTLMLSGKAPLCLSVFFTALKKTKQSFQNKERNLMTDVQHVCTESRGHCTTSKALVRWSNSFGNLHPPHTFSNVWLEELCRAISVTDNLTFTPTWRCDWPAVWKGEKVWTSLSLKLSVFLSWHNYFCHSSCEQLRATLWKPRRRD